MTCPIARDAVDELTSLRGARCAAWLERAVGLVGRVTRLRHGRAGTSGRRPCWRLPLADAVAAAAQFGPLDPAAWSSGGVRLASGCGVGAVARAVLARDCADSTTGAVAGPGPGRGGRTWSVLGSSAPARRAWPRACVWQAGRPSAAWPGRRRRPSRPCSRAPLVTPVVAAARSSDWRWWRPGAGSRRRGPACGGRRLEGPSSRRAALESLAARRRGGAGRPGAQRGGG